MKNSETLAFPVFNDKGECAADSVGLTKRELIAAMAMQGLISGNSEITRNLEMEAKAKEEDFGISLSRNAVSFADALLTELDKKNNFINN